MIRHYLKVAYRNLLRQKVFAFINIFGLATGLACSILIILYLNHEYSYNTFHNKNHNWLFTVMHVYKMDQLPQVETTMRFPRESSKTVSTMESNSSPVNIYMYILIAIFVLLNACINFINLTTARPSNRSKEVALRKVLGADRKTLVVQFLTESVLIYNIAVLLAMLMVEVSLPHLNNLLNINLNLSFTDYLKLLPFTLLFATLLGLISGIYPAIYHASFNPNAVLKNIFALNFRHNWLRNILAILQLTVSISILQGTLLVSFQLRFVQNKNPGFDKESLLFIERTKPLQKEIKAFMEEHQKCQSIESISLSDEIPVRKFDTEGFTLEMEESESLGRPADPLHLYLNNSLNRGHVNIRLDNQIKNMYKKEIETLRLMDVFTVIAILISSLGLFGLVASLTGKRTKELGVRKVLGSSVWEIINQITKEVIHLVIISYLFAAPLSFWWMKIWLNQFSVKTPVHPAIFYYRVCFSRFNCRTYSKHHSYQSCKPQSD